MVGGVCVIPLHVTTDFPRGFSRQRNQTPDSRAKTVVRTCPPSKKNSRQTPVKGGFRAAATLTPLCVCVCNYGLDKQSPFDLPLYEVLI